MGLKRPIAECLAHAAVLAFCAAACLTTADRDRAIGARSRRRQPCGDGEVALACLSHVVHEPPHQPQPRFEPSGRSGPGSSSFLDGLGPTGDC
jgi:hypothetical protein